MGQGKELIAKLAIVAVATSIGLGVEAQDGAKSPPAAPAGVDARALPPGYLERNALPDSLALLPPPPADGSAAMRRDEEVRISLAGLKGSPRYQQAAADAQIAFPHVAELFSCAMGTSISARDTPKLYALMSRMMVDVGLSTYRAKNHYQRVRPFAAHGGSTCYPDDDAALRKDGSYPSGHSALGWGWALVFAELNPERANDILQRGRDYGQSRLICDAHWESDVEAGRLVAAATVARLHASREFRADLEAARKEVERGRRERPGRTCT